MRVGLVLDRFDPAAGGLEWWTVGFARYLAEAGHQPVALAFNAAADLTGWVERLPAARGVMARAEVASAAAAALDADVVLDTGTGWGADVFMPCTGSRRWSQRQLVATHSAEMRLRAAVSPRSWALDRALRRIERAQMRRARHVIAVSELVRDLLARQHGVDPAGISVVPNGVETGRFDAARLAGLRGPARAGLGVGQAVLFLGSAHNMALKGMDTAIRAMALVDGAVLAIAGSTPDARWRRWASDRVRFLGPVDDMVAMFAAADALVHPTRWDACSLSTIEAGAAGLPVITTARNGAAALIQEGETGFVLADPEDVEALAERMRRLLDPAIRARMGEAARAASAAHDVRVNYAAVLAILQRHRRRSVRAGG